MRSNIRGSASILQQDSVMTNFYICATTQVAVKNFLGEEIHWVHTLQAVSVWAWKRVWDFL